MPETLEQPWLDLDSASYAKAEGAFIGLAAGDALGWPQELRGSSRGYRKSMPGSVDFRRWTRRDGGRFSPYESVIDPGEYSDDTQLTLAVARCRTIEASGWWQAWTRVELPLWTLYQRGGGSATRQAAASWAKGTPPWKNRDEKMLAAYFAAGGNGVAMRVLPHAVFHVRHVQTEDLLRDVVLDGVATHGHPRALVGAAIFTYAAWWLLRLERSLRFGELVDVLLDNSTSWGEFPEKEPTRNGWLDAANRVTAGEYESQWCQVVQEMKKLLEDVRHGLKRGALVDDQEVFEKLGCFGEERGSGTISAAAAVYLCARHAAQPPQGVIRAAFATGADTDTLAAMTGGLMGCLAGTDWLPREWLQVQDCKYLRQVAARLISGHDLEGRPVGGPHRIGHRELDGLLRTLAENRKEEFNLDGVRQAHVVETQALKGLSPATSAQTWKLKASDGQTLFITRVMRPSKQQHPVLDNNRQRLRAIKSDPTRAGATARAVKIGAADVAAASAFYEKALGLTPVMRSPRYVSYGAFDLVDRTWSLELLGGKTTETSALLGETRGEALFCRPCIEVQVDDLDDVLLRVEAYGARIVQGVNCTSWGARAFHCVDPEGNLVEVVERAENR